MSATTVTLQAHDTTPRRPFVARIFVGDRAEVVWARPALWALLVATAVLYLWNLEASGWANSFYAAAVQAGSEDWKAWFFGSLDSSNFITVDKPPASLWVMGLSARIFGFSSWSLLVPQALMGVASVALVYGMVRRSLASFGSRLSVTGGLLGGFVLAATPAAALMFKFDNPDALLVLLMTAAAYFVVRAMPKASWKWLALAGVALGFAFLTKMLQGLLVLPGFGLAYLLFAGTTWLKRLAHLGIAAVALVVSAGWWVLAVALWPAAARPYIGGSTDNTVLDLVFGYNGLGRIFGGSGNTGGGGGGNGASGSSFGGATGLQRLFSSEMGLEISWLLPAALLALVLGLVVTRTRAVRAAFVVLGGWLVVTGLVFSYMSGTIHPYYTVALAPAIGGLVGLGGIVLFRARDRWIGRLGLGAMLLGTGVWGFVLLSEDTTFLPGLRFVIIGVSLLASVLFVAGSTLGLTGLTAIALAAGMVAGLGGTTAYAVATASVAHSGSIPTASLTSTSMGGGGGFGGGQSTDATTTDGTADSSTDATTTSTTDITTLLQASTARWAAAINGSSSAATLELSTDTAIMAIGGWSSDPAPTLAQFQAWVASGDIGYYISGGQGGGGGGQSGASTESAISDWVAANYTATTVGSYTVYDLVG